MMGFTFAGGDETRRLNYIIARMRAGIDKNDLAHVISVSRAMKPWKDYDAFVDDVRRCYLGDQEDRTRAKLAESLPKSWMRIRPVPINIVTETAEIDAQLYRDTPERWLTVRGARVPDSDTRALAHAEMLRRAQHGPTMLELERITCAAETGFARVHWSPRADIYGSERHIVRPFWPSQVQALPSDDSPDRLSAAHVVMLKIAGGGTEVKESHDALWEVWRSDVVVVDKATGLLERRWFWQHITAGGQVLSPEQMYGERDLPILVSHVRDTSGALFATPDRALLSTQDTVNVANSDFWYGRQFGAHKQLALSGAPPRAGTDTKMGPDALLQSDDANATWQVLDMQQDTTTQDAIERELVLHGRSRRQPVDAWWTKGGNPETGVARQVRNQAADQKRAEHARLFASLEAEMQRVMARQADAFGDLDAVIDGDGVEYHARFPAPMFFEDLLAKQQRVLGLVAARIISPARAAVELGAYGTEAEAVAAGVSGGIDTSPAPAPTAPTEIPDAPSDTLGDKENADA